MAQYKLKALNCHICGIVRHKGDDKVFDDKKFGEDYLASLEKAGYLEKLSAKEAKVGKAAEKEAAEKSNLKKNK